MRVGVLSAAEDQRDGDGDIADALEGLGETDLLRLRALARLRARGLPDVGWADLLNEAILRALSGARRRPAGLSVVTFLAWTMRSIADEHWRRLRREKRVFVPIGDGEADPARCLPDQAADPEAGVAAAEQLSVLLCVFAEDAVATAILAGLAEGLTAAEIRAHLGLSETDYDSARKRMRRRLLRHGLGG